MATINTKFAYGSDLFTIIEKEIEKLTVQSIQIIVDSNGTRIINTATLNNKVYQVLDTESAASVSDLNTLLTTQYNSENEE